MGERESFQVWRTRLDVAAKLVTLVMPLLFWVAFTWARDIDRDTLSNKKDIEFLTINQRQISANVASATESTLRLAERMARLEAKHEEK